MIKRFLESLRHSFGPSLGHSGSCRFYEVTETYKGGELKRRVVHHSENWSEEDDKRVEKFRKFFDEMVKELDERWGEECGFDDEW